MSGFIEWESLPRGTYRAVAGDYELDVWAMGGGVWKWTALCRTTRAYDACGEATNLDGACDAALRFAGV